MQRIQLSSAEILNAIGLIIFGLSIPLQISMGVTNYPPIPPGLFIAIGTGLLILFGRWRWTIWVGIILSLIFAIGTILSGWLPKMLDPSSVGYSGIVLQMVGLGVALIGSGLLGWQRIQKTNKSD
jgi:peptidoglycan/LPS O-acetylase OafA/YrhL